MSRIKNKMESTKKWICRTMVQKPLVHLAVNWGVILTMVLIVFAGGYLDIYALVFNDFLITEEKDVQNFFSRINSVEQSAETFDEISFRSKASIDIAVFHLYESDDPFSPENIQAICKTERAFTAHPDYPFYCHTLKANGINTICLPQINAVTHFFYDVDTDCELLTQEKIDLARDSMLSTPEGVNLVNDINQPTLLRSTLVLGTPLGADSPPGKNFTTPVAVITDEEAQEGHSLLIDSYMKDLYELFDVEHSPPFKNAWDTSFFQIAGADVEIQIYGGLIEVLHVNEMLGVDQTIVALSFFSVLCVVWIYVRSFFLAFTGLISIALTMVVGIFFYAVLFQINYFTTLHVVSFFIILAIGANNLYVVVDAWKQSEEAAEPATDEEQYLINRLEYAYQRSALSVFNTSMTTFIAFIANLASPLSVIAGFGLFSGIVVVINFLFVLNVHPTHIIVYHFYFKKMSCYPTNKTENEPNNQVGMIEKLDSLEKEENILKDKKHTTNSDGTSKEESKFERFRSFYIHLIINTYFPYIGLIITTTVASVLIYFASQLQTPTTVEVLYAESYFWNDFFTIFNNDFVSGSENGFTETFTVFGIESLDRSGLKFMDTDPFRGSAVFDENFNFFTEETQNFIIEQCDVIETFPCSEGGCTLDTLVIPETMVCSLLEFREFFEATFNTTESFVTRADGTETGFTKEDILSTIEIFLSGVGAIHSSNIGLFSDTVKFITISFRQSMPVDQPYVIKEPVLELFDTIEADIIAEAPLGCETAFITSFDFAWSHTELAIVSGLFTGMALSLGLSYFVILFGTRHPLVSLYAIVGVALIVGCVLGTVQRFGWELGVTEAIAGVMVIGLAVDYIVHLGYMFMSAKLNLIVYDQTNKADLSETYIKNADMIRYSVEKMMLTILAGGATTFFAGVVLFLCTLSFFLKMATLIIFTSIYSVSFAFLFFVPLLRLAGPGKK